MGYARRGDGHDEQCICSSHICSSGICSSDICGSDIYSSHVHGLSCSRFETAGRGFRRPPAWPHACTRHPGARRHRRASCCGVTPACITETGQVATRWPWMHPLGCHPTIGTVIPRRRTCIDSLQVRRVGSTLQLERRRGRALGVRTGGGTVREVFWDGAVGGAAVHLYNEVGE